MLVNMKTMLEKAKKENYAIAQFNINNLEWTKYILEECNEQKSPVILGVSESAIKYMGGYLTVSNMVKALIKDLDITIPVSLNLDHAKSIDACKKAINCGFTSVMIDASEYTLEENIKITKQVVEYAHMRNVSVEAELGKIGTNNNINSQAIKVEDCIIFLKETGIDFFAPSIGNVHGMGLPKLDFKRMKEINEKVDLPLVLHGGSNISEEEIVKSIELGVCKININSELQYEWSKEVRKFIQNNENIYDPRKIIASGEQALKNVVHKKLTLFGTTKKA